jgi:hypothetical protein
MEAQSIIALGLFDELGRKSATIGVTEKFL